MQMLCCAEAIATERTLNTRFCPFPSAPQTHRHDSECYVPGFALTTKHTKDGLKELPIYLSPVMPVTSEQFDGSDLQIFLSKLGIG